MGLQYLCPLFTTSGLYWYCFRPFQCIFIPIYICPYLKNTYMYIYSIIFYFSFLYEPSVIPYGYFSAMYFFSPNSTSQRPVSAVLFNGCIIFSYILQISQPPFYGCLLQFPAQLLIETMVTELSCLCLLCRDVSLLHRYLEADFLSYRMCTFEIFHKSCQSGNTIFPNQQVIRKPVFPHPF